MLINESDEEEMWNALGKIDRIVEYVMQGELQSDCRLCVSCRPCSSSENGRLVWVSRICENWSCSNEWGWLVSRVNDEGGFHTRIASSIADGGLYAL